MRSACPLIVPQSHLTLFPSDHLSQHSQAGRLQRDWAGFVEHQKILSCPPVPTLLQPLSPLHSYSHSFCHGCEHPPGCLRLCTQTCLEFVPAARVPTQTWMRPRILDQAVPDSLALAGRGDSTPRWGEILVAQNSPSCV